MKPNKENMHRYLAYEVYGMKKVCEHCGIREGYGRRICVHHIDCNHYNNERINLQILCVRCHGDVHGKMGMSLESKMKISIEGKRYRAERKEFLEESKKTKFTDETKKKMSLSAKLRWEIKKRLIVNQ